MAVSEPSPVDKKKALDASEMIIRLQENIISTLYEDEQTALAKAMLENSDEQLAQMDKQMEDNLERAVVCGRKEHLQSCSQVSKLASF